MDSEIQEANTNRKGERSAEKEQVKRYILEQDGKSVFEYDIFNCPEHLKGQLKIGDFTGGD